MKRFSILFACALFVAGAGLAVGQGGGLANLASPLVVMVEQQVPAEVTFAIVHEGETVTVTAPITVGVSLRVTLDSVAGVVAAVESRPHGDDRPIAEDEEATDATGRDFTVETADWLRVEQLQASIDTSGRFLLLGEVTNVGDEDALYVRATVSFYDDAGRLIGVGEADTSPRTIAPGRTAPFSLVSAVDTEEIVRYRVTVE